MLNALGFLYSYLNAYLEREDGQDFIEYALIVALIVLVGVGTMGALGGQIGAIWGQIAALLPAVGGG